MAEDYYTTLNVDRNATSDQLKKSYRKLAIKWHPDKNKGDSSAEEKFKKISEAYDILSDDTKRSQYDQFGHAAFNQQRQSNRPHDPFDIFNSFFGQGARVNPNSNFFTREGNGRSSENSVGSNLKIDVEVSLEDIIKEKKINLSYNRQDKCNPCGGNGQTSSSSIQPCHVCGGRGVVYRQLGPMQMEQPCPSCKGGGSIIKNPCRSCSGSGVNNKKMNTSINVPVGSHTGIKLRLTDLGNYDKGGYGDLYAYIFVKQHELYERDSDDVIRKLELPFEDIILGTTQIIDSLHGSVKIKIPRLSKPDSVLRISDYGIPNMSTHKKGDMFVVLNSKFPSNLTDEQVSILELYKKSK